MAPDPANDNQSAQNVSSVATWNYLRSGATHTNWSAMRACAIEFTPNAAAHRMQAAIELADTTDASRSKAGTATALKLDELVRKVHFPTSMRKIDKISAAVGHTHSPSEVTEVLLGATGSKWEHEDIHNVSKGDDVVRLATANISTLDPKEFKDCLNNDNEAVLTARVSFLEDAFKNTGIDIVGVQESRIQGDLHVCGNHYDIRMAGAESTGRSGVQLWTSLKISKGIISTIPVSPRLLFVVIRVNGCLFLFVVAYGPQEDADSGEKNAFWCSMGSELTKVRNAYPEAIVVLLIDANAKVGSITCSAIGGASADPENDNGGRLRLFCCEQELTIVNTFIGSGPTWSGLLGDRHRIDYLGLSTATVSRVRFCRATPEVDISTFKAARYDHNPVVADLSLDSGMDTCPSSIIPERAFCKNKVLARKLDRTSITDPTKVKRFQEALARSLVTLECSTDMDPIEIDAKLNSWNQTVRDLAGKIFSAPRRKPRKSWMSENTWIIVRWIAPIRRRLFSLRVAHKRLVLSTGTGDKDTFNLLLQASSLEEQRCLEILHALQRTARAYVRNDKRNYLESLATQAADASLQNDFAASYRIIRMLGGTQFKQSQVVWDKAGNDILTPEDVKLRWQEHFVEVFDACVVGGSELEALPPSLAHDFKYRDYSLCDIEAQVWKLGKRKACGPDDICAELIQAGGLPYVRFLHAIIGSCCKSGYVAQSWRGGKIKDLWKAKGTAKDCNNSRGLLLSDHSGKVLTGLLQADVDAAYHSYIGPDQHGCAAGHGTEFAVHMSRAFSEWCNMMGRSCFILFVDLTKAFDLAIRELLLGWRQNFMDDPIDFLVSVGLDQHNAEAVAADIHNNGCLLTQLGLPEGVVELIRSLHTGTWFRYADLDSVILTHKGGRQGCKLGGVIFNLIYARALHKLRKILLQKGVLLQLSRDPQSAFFSKPSANSDAHESVPIVEATYVDDEALFLSASSPKALDTAIDILLIELIATFSAHGFQINWKPGKSEAILKYRGQGARAAAEARLHEGRTQVKLPTSADREFLNVVDVYKHVGSIASSDGSVIPDAKQRSSSALAAYLPLVGSVFSSARIPVSLKLKFADSGIPSVLPLVS